MDVSNTAVPGKRENLWIPLAAALFVVCSGLGRIGFRLAHNFQPKTMAETLPILVMLPILLTYYAVRTRRGQEPLKRYFQYMAVSAALVCAAVILLP